MNMSYIYIYIYVSGMTGWGEPIDSSPHYEELKIGKHGPNQQFALHILSMEYSDLFKIELIN